MKELTETKNKLWTRDFTIITVGSMISLIGNALSGFASSLMVLDYTNSSLLYSIYIIIFTLPQIIMPVLSGAFLDRFSRKKTIYTLDFLSAFLYLLIGLVLRTGWFSFPVFAIYVFIIGSIQAIYQVAYSSFYPLLISEGNYSKAYSVASFMETVIVFVTPLATLLYERVGIAPLLLANSVFFFTAACVETQIQAKEQYVEKQKKTEKQVSKAKQMLLDTKEGFLYLKGEKGLLFVAIYFAFSSLGGGVSSVVGLPYMKSAYANGVFLYSLMAFFSISGRSVMSIYHYRKKLPTEKKFAIALFVYIAISVIEGSMYYTPLPVMYTLLFVSGLCGVTSWTIRISATQSYVPDEKKGRFNGAFNMISTVGTLLGEAVAGVLSVYLPLRAILAGTMVVVGCASIVLIGGHKKDIAPIYNRQQ